MQGAKMFAPGNASQPGVSVADSAYLIVQGDGNLVRSLLSCC